MSRGQQFPRRTALGHPLSRDRHGDGCGGSAFRPHRAKDGGIWPVPPLWIRSSLACAAYSTSTTATIVFLSLTLLSAYSLLGPFWATSTELLSETSAVAGIALINSFGNLGGFLGPYTIGLIRSWTGELSRRTVGGCRDVGSQRSDGAAGVWKSLRKVRPRPQAYESRRGTAT